MDEQRNRIGYVLTNARKRLYIGADSWESTVPHDQRPCKTREHARSSPPKAERF